MAYSSIAGESVLDAGTGTADVAIMLANHLKELNKGAQLGPDRYGI
jgi:ubiquinone/menaquinone biosynthesis C-methylase UbiE